MADNDPSFQPHDAFDAFADDYDTALNRGLALSGEGPDYFAGRRVQYTAGWLHSLDCVAPGSVGDFGCGVGATIPHIERWFPGARIGGMDVSTRSLERAREMFGARAAFTLLADGDGLERFDLVYCNGVFHHIRLSERAHWARLVFEMTNASGHVALWENNPWNPGARMVMRRIPFDRDAVMISYIDAQAMLRDAGFQICGARFYFYFPRALAAFRPLERFGQHLPLGAQYCVLARKAPPQLEADGKPPTVWHVCKERDEK